MDKTNRRRIDLLKALEERLNLLTRQGASENEINATRIAIERVKSKLNASENGHQKQYENEFKKETRQNQTVHDDSTSRPGSGVGIIIIEEYVRYNGKTFSFDKCSSASNLTEGKVYGIIKEEMLESALMYYIYDPILQVILPGYYNCTWFDQVIVKQEDSFEVPIVGKTFKLTDGTVISPPLRVHKDSENRYFVFCKTFVYYIYVLR